MFKLKRLKGRNISLTHEQIFNKHLKHFENVEVICIFYLEQSCVYNNMKISNDIPSVDFLVSCNVI